MRPSGWLVLDGVVGEIEQELLQAVTVASHGHFVTGFQFDGHAAGLRQQLRVREAVSDQFSEPDGFLPESELAGVRFRQERERVYNLGEACDFVELIGEDFTLGRRVAGSRNAVSVWARMMVSGVLSSCEALSVNSRMCVNDSSRRVIIELNTSVRRSSSSPLPVRGRRSLRLWTWMRSAARVRLVTGERFSQEPPTAHEQQEHGGDAVKEQDFTHFFPGRFRFLPLLREALLLLDPFVMEHARHHGEGHEKNPAEPQGEPVADRHDASRKT